MKKFISMILAGAMSLLLISGCSTSSGTPPASVTPAAPTEPNASTNTNDYEWPVTTWRVAHACGDESPSDIGCDAFADYIMEKTNGSITVEVYPAGALGTDIQQVESCQLGDLEFTSGSSFALNQISGIDGTLMWDLPWHFAPWRIEAGDDIKLTQDDPAYQEIFVNGLQTKGIKYLAQSNIGSYVLAGLEPFNSAVSLEGKKIRAAENAMLVEALTEWGAQPVVINMFELFTALQQGTCDGAYVPDSLIYQLGTYEATPYITYIEGAITPCYLSCSVKFFEAQAPELQQLIVEASQRYCDESFAAEKEQVSMWIDAFEAAGCTIVRLTQEEKEAFRANTDSTHAHWRELIGEDLYDMSVAYTASVLKGKNIEIPK